AYLFLQVCRSRVVARAVLRLGAKRLPDDQVIASYVRNAVTNRGVRRDITKCLRGLKTSESIRSVPKLAAYRAPALIAWAPEDRVFELGDGRRLAELLPQARYVEIPDCRTFIGEDQPQ